MNVRASRRLPALVAAALILPLAACGGSDDDASPSDGRSTSGEETGTDETGTGEAGSDDAGGTASDGASDDTSGGTSAEDYYPHTVRSLYGDVTIEQEPERIVALWSPIGDDLHALGAMPVAVAGDPATYDEAMPWIPDELREITDPALVTPDGINVEAVAALEPDLIIVAPYQVQDEAVFDQLSVVAPTISVDTEGLNPDWDERLLLSAEAVNETGPAQELIAETEADFAEVGAQVPGIEDMTYNWVLFNQGQYGFGNGSVLELFGLSPADSQDNSNSADAGLSPEQTSLLDADLLAVWPVEEDGRETLEADPLFQNLPSVQADTVHFASLAMADALNVPDPYALPWFLEEITPTILALGE
ncbi:possible ABC Fe(3+) transporter, periplasmic binding protein [Actinomycetales bacterium JB111]|nr:possible ABC Fe(3+) transporter, periplasmic binding protein [Actinomycetales bacterium JB111]